MTKEIIEVSISKVKKSFKSLNKKIRPKKLNGFHIIYKRIASSVVVLLPRNDVFFESSIFHLPSSDFQLYYIIPGIPPPIGGIAPSGFGTSVITHSVVNSIPDTEAAFSKATLVTLVGSIIPASSMFTYSSVFAL